MSPEIAKALRFGTPLHRRVSDALRARLRMSEQKMKGRYAQMAKNEELFQAYIPERDVDALRRLRREESGTPDYRTIELPYSYALAMTAHTYYTSVFLARNPVFQLMGRHGESEQQVQAMEALLAYQLSVGSGLVPLFIWLLDPAKYGYGVVAHNWHREIVRTRRIVEQPVTFLGMPIPGAPPRRVPVVEDTVGFEGNRLFNVRAQDFFPDPRVPLLHFQQGEFCGRYVEVPWNEIYEGQRDFRYFNYGALKQLRDRNMAQAGGQPVRDIGSEKVTTLPDVSDVGVEQGYDVPVGFVKGHEVFVKLSPSEWGLGSESRQEIWGFNIATNGLIFGAGPLGEYHGKFPFDILLDEIDGYTLFPKSMLERSKSLNDVMTWLINTHFYNVRAALNNQFIGDPSMIVMKDVENPEPGKFIRLKPSAYGKDVRTVIAQLPVTDITRAHMADVQTVGEFLQRAFGINDAVMGMLDPGGRKTATEVRTSTSLGINRLKTQCEWYSATGFSQLTQKLVQRTQQYYSASKKFRIVGDLAQFSPQFLEVRPEDISGFYDFEPVDGTMPIDRFAQANLWQMLMGQLVNFPQILAQYDIAKIFAWVANLAGIKNVAQFRLTPDATLMQQAAAGNVVPLKTAMKEARVNLNEPRQSPLAGPTG